MAKQRIKHRVNWKAIICGVLAVLLIAGVCVGVISVLNKGNAVKTIHPSFVRGTLDENGADVESRTSIVTQNYLSCRGLEIMLNDKSSSTYKVYYYSCDKEFIDCTEDLQGMLNDELPFGTAYARIVLTPSAQTDLSFLDVWTYSSELSIKVNRNQKIELMASFTFGESDVSKTETSDGISVGTDLMYEDNGYAIYLSNFTSVYKDSYDSRGTCCLKIGSGNGVGSFDLLLPDCELAYMVIYVTGYKDKFATIKIGDNEEQKIITKSSDGEYTAVKVDVLHYVNDILHFTTCEDGMRCKISKIELYTYADVLANN